ncbi:MAG: hypothetical protein QME54_02660 [Actinomycetota bacterium]|nr:hypothetical protein [Actinomycetota bacterium]
MSEGELVSIVKVSHMAINRLMKELRALNLVTDPISSRTSKEDHT